MSGKRFMYFENTEGGMNQVEVRDSENIMECLYGWKRADCFEEDNALLGWMENAEVGDLHYHRLGTLVRLKDY